MPQLIRFAEHTPQPTIDHPRADRRVRGNPQRLTWEHFVSQHGDLSAGIWSCETGAWNIAFADGKDEFFCVISGHIRIISHDGEGGEFGPGEAGVIPAGFTGRFEVLEPVRKYFVVVDRPPPVAL